MNLDWRRKNGGNWVTGLKFFFPKWSKQLSIERILCGGVGGRGEEARVGDMWALSQKEIGEQAHTPGPASVSPVWSWRAVGGRRAVGRNKKTYFSKIPLLCCNQSSNMTLYAFLSLVSSLKMKTKFSFKKTKAWLKAMDHISSVFSVSTSGKYNIIWGTISLPASEQKMMRGSVH